MTAQPEASPTPRSEPGVWVRLPVGRPFTQSDRDELPELPGLRVELVDGTLVVSPGPNLAHQRMLGRLNEALRAACPPHLEVLFAPYDVQPSEQRTFQPDLMVARSADYEERSLRKPAQLFVEIASPSTTLYDQTLKRAAYEQAGTASYWLVDPLEPAMTVLELHQGAYREVARIRGDEAYEAYEAYEARRPYPVRITLR